MRYLSICSGIESASVAWHPLGWEPVAFAEIDPFASAVLAHHYPSVPNWGDITKFKEWPDATFDVLVGGTPCQSFSIAGLRRGLADPRGNLTLTYLAIAERYKPQWVVWENVPGILSDPTGALHAFLDGLESLGYVIDVDILDAQFFGLAQRRRRLFVCGQRADFLLASTTHSSLQTISQCLLETLHGILTEVFQRYGCAPSGLGCHALSTDGALRRIRLFGLVSGTARSAMWRVSLDAHRERLLREQASLSLEHGGANRAACIAADPSMDLRMDVQSTLIEPLWSERLDAVFDLMKSFTTSTATSGITDQKTYTCLQAALSIAQLIVLSNASSPSFWSAASSALTLLQDGIHYARSANSDLFARLDGVLPWHDFIGEAERTIDALANTRTTNFGQIFSLSESLSGNPPPRREARKKITGTLSARTQGGGGLGTDFDIDGGLVTAFGGNNQTGPIDVATAQTAHGGTGRLDFESETFVAHALRGEGFDASEDGTGRGTPIVPVQGVALRGRDGGATAELTGDVMTSLRTGGGGGDKPHVLAPSFALQAGTARENPSSGPDGVGVEEGIAYTLEARAEVQAVCFDETQITSAENRCNPQPGDPSHPLAKTARPPTIAFTAKDYGGDAVEDISPTLRAGGFAEIHANAGVMPAVLTGWRVRRLLPVECEKLQGFPPGYTAITYRGKPAADGPRYKALGNSKAVNVVRWIGDRIAGVTELGGD